MKIQKIIRHPASRLLLVLPLLGLLFVTSCQTTPGSSGESSASLQGSGAGIGRSIYYSRCTACHAAYSPGSRTLSQWRHVVADMKGRAKLDYSQTADLMAFLSAKAADS